MLKKSMPAKSAPAAAEAPAKKSAVGAPAKKSATPANAMLLMWESKKSKNLNATFPEPDILPDGLYRCSLTGWESTFTATKVSLTCTATLPDTDDGHGNAITIPQYFSLLREFDQDAVLKLAQFLPAIDEEGNPTGEPLDTNQFPATPEGLNALCDTLNSYAEAGYEFRAAVVTGKAKQDGSGNFRNIYYRSLWSNE